MTPSIYCQLFFVLTLIGASCNSEAPVSEPCTAYHFKDGLQIIGIEDRSCQDGDVGRTIQKLAQWQRAWLEDESLRITPQQLEEIGQKQADELLETAEIINGRDRRRVQNVFNQLVEHTVRRDIEYSLYLITHLKKPELINAWVTANGTVFITTAMLEFMETDNGLAFILAHELAHVENLAPDYRIARNQKMRNFLGGSNAVSEFLVNSTESALQPLNQYQEIIADRAALYLMYEAGYNPEVALHIFYALDKMEKNGGVHPFRSFVTTHPYHHTRFDCLNSYLFESKEYYDPCPTEIPN